MRPALPLRSDLIDVPRTGPADAGEIVYRRYGQRLSKTVQRILPRSLARRIDPEDISQSVFRRFLGRYGSGENSVPDGPNLWNLLLAIAQNKIRDETAYHQAACRDIRREARAEFMEAISSKSPESAFLTMVLEELMTPLSTDQRAVIELRLAGHGVTEIAVTLGRPLRTIERYLQEFRGLLAAA